MATMDRRAFLGRTAAFAGAGLFSSTALETLLNRQALRRRASAIAGTSTAQLFPTPDLTTGREPAGAPKGFSYRTFGAIGSTMSDGNITPLALDGMAAFPHPTDPNLIRLIRNHEDRNGTNNPSNLVTAAEAPFIYDPSAGGGCSTLDYDPRDGGRLVRDFISLKGTIINCAGGYSLDYRHWLTGEEVVSVRNNRRHGYVFPVPGHARVGGDAERHADRPDGPVRARGGGDRSAQRDRLRDRGRRRGLRLGLLPLHPGRPVRPLQGRHAADAGHRRPARRRPAPGPGHRASRSPSRGSTINTPDTNSTNNNQAGSVFRQGFDQGGGAVQPARGHLVGRRGLDVLRLDQRRRRQEHADAGRRRLPAGVRADLAVPRQRHDDGADPRLRVRRHGRARLARQPVRARRAAA